MSAMSAPKYLTGDSAAIASFIDQFDVFLFDCDGVLWSGDHVFPGTAETLAKLRELGKRLIFVTNNSTKSRANYAAKFETLQIPVSATDEIFGSSYSAATYIARNMGLQAPKNKVFVLGESGIEEELRAEGVSYICGTDPAYRREMRPDDYAAIAQGTALDPDVAVVLAGLDFHPSYYKLSVALAHLQRGAHFLATNSDSTLPSAGGLFPGAGSMMAPLVTAAGKKPLSLGKPSQAMMDAIEGRFQLDRKRTCMVGDRLDTDIRFGVEGGLGGTLAVLTGVSKKTEFLGEGKEIVPAAYVDKLGDLLG